MASKINVTNSNNMTMKRIMQVWKTEWIPVYGNDFNKFCEFVFDKHGIDIASDSASFNLSEFYDMNPSVKERKTIKNILQPEQASLSKKSSKDHKLKHREEKRDKTKKPDAKRASRVHKESLKIKFDREN
jgi:hypothetical protein